MAASRADTSPETSSITPCVASESDGADVAVGAAFLVADDCGTSDVDTPAPHAFAGLGIPVVAVDPAAGFVTVGIPNPITQPMNSATDSAHHLHVLTAAP